MSNELHDDSSPDPSVREEDFFAGLAGDENYWDYLDDLEVEMGGCHEWDNASVGGAA